MLLQLLGMTIALTALFTTGGYGGVIPNAEVVREFGALLSGAWHQILVSAPPAPSTPELVLPDRPGASGLAAIIVDFLIAEAHAPALVALPLLCLYSVPASIADDAAAVVDVRRAGASCTRSCWPSPGIPDASAGRGWASDWPPPGWASSWSRPCWPW